jgi:signal peptidase I
MAYIPVTLLIALVGYAIFAVFTAKSVNFALLLFLAVCVCGIAWAMDKWVWSKKRPAGEPAPSHIDVPASIFFVLLAVFLLRSFLAEPFRIPSSSMRPTLEVGDFILVNKYKYGIRLPVIDKKVLDTGAPARGDVAVFRYPLDPTNDYIKRIVGVPGDLVEYRNKSLTINGVPSTQVQKPAYGYVQEDSGQYVTNNRYTEKIGELTYDIAVNPAVPTLNVNGVLGFAGKEGCEYADNDGFKCKVPAGHYFAMGDNRDNSLDSRYWGFVPDSHLKGKAFFIWFNWADVIGLNFNRVGSSVK